MAAPFIEHQGALVPLAWITVMHEIARSTGNDSLIMIRGEPGAGKDVLARMLHAASGRGAHPFIKVNCAAPPDHLASQLFGRLWASQERTGRRKLGALELAHRGTLLLDDIGALPPVLQPYVLHFFEKRRIDVGSADVQVLLATRQSLMGEGQPWDSDPVLRILDVELPPLRVRREQIAPLAEFFLSRFNAWYGRSVYLSLGDLRLLTDYVWPGNVRELESQIRRLVVAPDPTEVLRHMGSALARNITAMDRRTA
jgi:DNA-binding NtrC family response regulator